MNHHYRSLWMIITDWTLFPPLLPTEVSTFGLMKHIFAIYHIHWVIKRKRTQKSISFDTEIVTLLCLWCALSSIDIDLFFQMIRLKSSDGVYNDWSRDIKGNMYDIVVEGFQLLSRWTGRIWEQCAWKFSRPISDSQQNSMTCFDYEKVLSASLKAVLTFLQLLIPSWLLEAFISYIIPFPFVAACLSGDLL